MRVYCRKCYGKGRIASREELSRDFVKLYCQCLDVKCGHTWVSNLTFSHTLKPPATEINQLLLDALREMPRKKQLDIFNALS